jgi:hypothetical protein
MMAQRNITDRAYRYRAQKNAPDTEKRCAFCGAKEDAFIEVGHVDGHEENDSPENLIWTCRPCNVVAGNTLRAAGRGRLTHQYNPSKGKGATSLGQWMQAVGAITPHQDRGDRGLVSDMSVPAAVEMIRATPQSRRSKFASELRKHSTARRRAADNDRWNPAIKKNIWPFSDSRLSARRTTPASGGIAKFSKGVKVKAKKAVASAKKSGDYDSIPSAAQVEQAYASGAKTLKEALEMAGARMNPGWVGAVFDESREGTRAVVIPKGNKWAVVINGITRTVKSTQKGAIGAARRVLQNPARNPASESAKAFKDFHGKPVEHYVEVKERIHTHGYLAAAGELRMLEVDGVDGYSHKISGFKGALLAFNEARNQLFVKGGDQSVNLADFGIEPKKAHELETLGAVVKIDYFADKKHLGDEGGRAVYRHKFRTTNENGKHVTIRVARYPDLIYRVLEKRLEFSGGSYEILPEGIDR